MEPGLLKSADWPLLIDLYFFLGGVAGGAFLIATIAQLLDGRRYRDVVRVGYYVAFLAIVPAPLLLIIDLGLPTRFLHMMMVSKPSVAIGMGAVTLGPFHFKPLSPMNVGAWALLGFSLFAFLAALDVFLEDRGGRSMVRLRTWVGIIGSLLGFFIAA
jgi:formate-dependent nitrite reductase membrane component NrfD